MADRTKLKVALTGLLVTALCCFTPLLVVGLGALGLATLTGYLDVVLFPLLAIFAVWTGYLLWKMIRQR